MAPWARSLPPPGAAGADIAQPHVACDDTNTASVPLVPSRAIFSETDLLSFRASPAYAELLRFVRLLSEAVKGCPIPASSASSSAGVRAMEGLLGTLEAWVDDFPPIQQPMRFGNRAFRSWHARLVSKAPALLRAVLKSSDTSDAPLFSSLVQPASSSSSSITACTISENAKEGADPTELAPYLEGSFGDVTRIDYGTGHETAFVSLLYCLSRAGAFQPADAGDLVLVVFARYVLLMRKLQSVYMLEPAGSHGVWGLDDFHCLPFLWGAAQLMDRAPPSAKDLKNRKNSSGAAPDLSAEGDDEEGTEKRDEERRARRELVHPSCVHDARILAEFGRQYLYLSSVEAVLRFKTGAPFAETSPMLASISQLESWKLVHSGLVRLYEGDVLSKLPVIQHFLFGRFLPAPWRLVPAMPQPSKSGSSQDTSSPGSNYRNGHVSQVTALTTNLPPSVRTDVRYPRATNGLPGGRSGQRGGGRSGEFQPTKKQTETTIKTTATKVEKQQATAAPGLTSL